MKKEYIKPEMQVFKMKKMSCLLAGSAKEYNEDVKSEIFNEDDYDDL